MTKAKYEQPDYCTCLHGGNYQKRPCGKCGKVPKEAYFSVRGFVLKDEICLCHKCHDEVDDCKKGD